MRWTRLNRPFGRAVRAITWKASSCFNYLHHGLCQEGELQLGHSHLNDGAALVVAASAHPQAQRDPIIGTRAGRPGLSLRTSTQRCQMGDAHGASRCRGSARASFPVMRRARAVTRQRAAVTVTRAAQPLAALSCYQLLSSLLSALPSDAKQRTDLLRRAADISAVAPARPTSPVAGVCSTSKSITPTPPEPLELCLLGRRCLPLGVHSRTRV